MRMRFGIDPDLEDQADALLHDSLEGVFAHSAKNDILTPWKMKDRLRREVYLSGEDEYNKEVLGQPDRSIRSGMFHRVRNLSRADLNSRDCIAPVHRVSRFPCYDFGLTFPDSRKSHDTITLEEWKRRKCAV
jgi:hypothetical protein